MFCHYILLDRGARKELVSEIAGVASPRMALDAGQARLLGEMMRDPTALGDLWSGPGREVYPVEAGEGMNWDWRTLRGD